MKNQTYPVVSKSISGRFFTDESCIYCELCVETAPANFAYDDSIGCAYLFKQPSTDEEIRRVIEALEGCPTESIGDRDNYKPNPRVLEDDPWGLDSGVTPKSLGGALFQSIGRLFRNK